MFLSDPFMDVKTREREFVGKAWRNICEELWHLCPYIVWPGEQGMFSGVKMG